MENGMVIVLGSYCMVSFTTLHSAFVSYPAALLAVVAMPVTPAMAGKFLSPMKKLFRRRFPAGGTSLCTLVTQSEVHPIFLLKPSAPRPISFSGKVNLDLRVLNTQPSDSILL